MIARVIIAIVIVLVAATTYPGAVAVSMAIRLTPSPASASPSPPQQLPWLHVEHRPDIAPYIADDQGRLVLLHGAIPASLLEFGKDAASPPSSPPVYPLDPAAYEGSCPETSTASRYPPLCQSDLVQMAALGFNSLRLPLSWSLLEPDRDRFSEVYLTRITQVVEWARALGIYVIIDMHQNAYSPFIPSGDGVNLAYHSGAPPWATLTDGVQSKVFLKNQREANPAVFQAFSNFWYNRNGIQDAYIAALGYLAKRFKDDSTVVGYSIFNEPQPGWNLPPGFEDLLLFPFYRRVIDSLTGIHDGLPCPTGIYMPAFCGYADLGIHDRRHLFFLEPGLLRQITDFPTHLGMPVSSYRNLVYDIHDYTHIYTIEALLKPDADPRQATYPWGGYEQTYAFGIREAKAMEAALFVSEFGGNPKDDSLLLANELLQQEKYLTGFAFWAWKENSGGKWGVYDPAEKGGCLRTARERLLARVYPRASADLSLSYHYDPDTGGFRLTGRGRAGDAPTIVFIPSQVRGSVAVSGTSDPETSTGADGSRVVAASPTGGPFSIAVGPERLALSGCG